MRVRNIPRKINMGRLHNDFERFADITVRFVYLEFN